MSEAMLGNFPIIYVKTNNDICREAPEIICKAFDSCDDCPFNGVHRRAGVMLIIERKPDHEKN